MSGAGAGQVECAHHVAPVEGGNGIDQLGRDYDECELETEPAGPVYQLIARYSF